MVASQEDEHLRQHHRRKRAPDSGSEAGDSTDRGCGHAEQPPDRGTETAGGRAAGTVVGSPACGNETLRPAAPGRGHQPGLGQGPAVSGGVLRAAAPHTVVSVGTALPRPDTEAGRLPHPPGRTAQHRRPDSPRPRHLRKHRPRRPLTDQRKGKITPSSSSSTKWAWTIRLCAASWASELPQRLNV